MMQFKGISFGNGFAEDVQRYFSRAQHYVDTEAVRLMEPYTPKKTGKKVDIGATGAPPGFGVVQYRSSIARRNYYMNKGTGKEGTNARKGAKGLRGKFWLERMKADHKDEILKGVKRLR